MRRVARISQHLVLLGPEATEAGGGFKPRETEAPPGAELKGTEVISHAIVAKLDGSEEERKGRYTSPNGGLLRYTIKGDPKNPVFEISGMIVPSVFRGKQPPMGFSGFDGIEGSNREIPAGSRKISEGLAETAYTHAKSLNAKILPS